MLCELCSGHQNPDENRFCGMCGMPLEGAVFKSTAKQGGTHQTGAPQGSYSETANVALSDDHAALSKVPNFEDPAAETAPPLSGSAHSKEESAARYSMLPSSVGLQDSSATSSNQARGTRQLGGLSLLGLDRVDGTGNYLLDEEPRTHWRRNLLVLVTLGCAVLGALRWHTELQKQAEEIAAFIRPRMNIVPPPLKPQQAPNSAENAPSPASAAPANASAAPVGDTPNAAARRMRPAESLEESRRSGYRERNRRMDRATISESNSQRSTVRADNPMLVKAQEYLHARNCEQGMIYLRQALRQASPEALSQMGALYATGTCVPQNRVEAYRWFSAALNMAPTNSWLTRERNMLHGEMTNTERQQIDR